MPLRLNIQTKLVGTLVLAGLVPLLAALALLLVSVYRLRIESIGQSFQTAAHMEAEQAATVLSDQVELAYLLSRLPGTVEFLERANRADSPTTSFARARRAVGVDHARRRAAHADPAQPGGHAVAVDPPGAGPIRGGAHHRRPRPARGRDEQTQRLLPGRRGLVAAGAQRRPRGVRAAEHGVGRVGGQHRRHALGAGHEPGRADLRPRAGRRRRRRRRRRGRRPGCCPEHRHDRRGRAERAGHRGHEGVARRGVARRAAERAGVARVRRRAGAVRARHGVAGAPAPRRQRHRRRAAAARGHPAPLPRGGVGREQRLRRGGVRVRGRRHPPRAARAPVRARLARRHLRQPRRGAGPAAAGHVAHARRRDGGDPAVLPRRRVHRPPRDHRAPARASDGRGRARVGQHQLPAPRRRHGAAPARGAPFRHDEIGALAADFNKMADRLRDNVQRLEHADLLKRQFIDVASHELRTPITYILGVSQLAERQEGHSPLLAKIAAKARRLARIIDNMFKLQGGSYESTLHHGPVDVRAIVDAVRAELQPFLHERRQQWDLRLDPAVRVFRGDPDKIRDVIHNLLSNAIRFSPDNAKVSLHAAPRETSRGPGVEVTVTDAGPGIPIDELPHLFEPFGAPAAGAAATMHHTSGDFGHNTRGIGLGLSVVKRFVDLHGGMVTAETSTTGTRMRVWLPTPAADDGPRASPDHAGGARAGAGASDASSYTI